MPEMRHVDVADYPAPHSPYSHAVVANGFVFVSGQIPVADPPTSLAAKYRSRRVRLCATSKLS